MVAPVRQSSTAGQRRPSAQKDSRRTPSALSAMAAAVLAGAAIAACSQTIAQPDPTPAASHVAQMTDLLQTVLAGEYAATYAYGVIGGQLTTDADRRTALEDLDAHDNARDRLRTELVALGAEPSPPAPAYSLPTPIHSAAEARALAADVEARLAAQWMAVADAAVGSPLEQWARQSASASQRRSEKWSTKPPSAKS